MSVYKNNEESRKQIRKIGTSNPTYGSIHPMPLLFALVLLLFFSRNLPASSTLAVSNHFNWP